ncbi:MAG TPA: hypothetical protein DCS07_14120 [Bdellovibrionales bacterium]|nr:MAG: hypothetical protein A2Z97_08445 [Bdellovibrionales bacterium GWB1_52_6]OFZ02387.1 MAG: hypothetical protein A2X97_12615 [Bdellovibrionales bacterium GWA1_52_35]OFZ40884.1 MAG: hypothetical protein A2070_11195 [Bdellovibrionales bacterium GWC1_52_8]HAR43747.1 hypothetical protein [Bdellovibrionales bacterium]HCM41585.1 hypothetical protein [Bdellovibrionales bacterium]
MVLFFNLLVSSASAGMLENVAAETAVTGATIVCGDSKGGFAFNAIDGRVWQLDTVESQEGIELKVIQFGRMRCPHCFDISAELSIFDDVLAWRLVIAPIPGGNPTRPFLKAIMKSGKEERKYNRGCRLVRNS